MGIKGSLKIVVAGEVDAGKSTLIGRFLYEMDSLPLGLMEEMKDEARSRGKDLEFAYLLDSFQEERNGELTIDTTQAFCKNKKGRDFLFIDVPGHRELLKNMLSGSSYADMAAIVIDVRKSVEEQTRRHAFILKFLGVEEIVFILNKMDLAGFSQQVFNRVRKEALSFCDKVNILPGNFIPVSASRGDNLVRRSEDMPWYEGESLFEALNNPYPRMNVNRGAFRFVVQDIYEIKSQKIAAGEVISGKINKLESVTILPLLKTIKIKGIIIFNKYIFSARAPQSAGLILKDMAGIKRGQIICKPRGLAPLLSGVEARVFSFRSLRAKEKLSLKCATQECGARITSIKHIWDTASLSLKISPPGIIESGDAAEVFIALDRPLVLENSKGRKPLGKFILKKDDEICAMGLVS